MCATSRCDLDLTLDHAVVTLIFKILSGLYVRNLKLTHGRDIGQSSRCATSCCDLDLTIDSPEVILTLKSFRAISQKP